MNGIQEHKDLRPLNTFGVAARARYFTEIADADGLSNLFRHDTFRNMPLLVLGGGSNILFKGDFNGLVIHCSVKGIRTETTGDSEVLVTAGAGESWHGLVTHCVESGLGGIENLALIPGSCGAAPIQNIGAYGREVESVIEGVEGIHLMTGETFRMSREECHFGYRESIFKHDFEKKFFISSVTLRLTHKNHVVNSGYEALAAVLGPKQTEKPTIREVYDAVVEVRKKKLPDPAVTGNAGSFFKNPIITAAQLAMLREMHSSIPFYNVDNQHVKVPAGWLIEQAGWKGKQEGHVGVHKHQALVIVNHGNATGSEILTFSQRIQTDVSEKFGITLEREVNVV